MPLPDPLFGALIPPHPLGEARRSSIRRANEMSQASFDGATNLLVKAKRALASGDDDRADRLVRRASAIPFDPHEEHVPAAGAASMMLFTAVTDEVETADQDDSTWLAAAVSVLDETTGTGRADLQHCLMVINQDFRLQPAEAEVVRRAVAETDPSIVRLDDLPDGSSDLTDRVRALLAVCVAYERALADLREAGR